MSKLSIKTLWVSLFIAGLVFMFGHGYRLGKNAQLTMNGAVEIAKNQFKCEMIKR